MAIDTTGQSWRGEGFNDLAEYLREFEAGGHSVDRVNELACPGCGGKALRVDADETAGCARIRCLACDTEAYIADSAEYADEGNLAECSCSCGGETFNVCLGFALREDGEVRWISLGLRCVQDGLLGVYADWKIDYSPTGHLLTGTASVRPAPALPSHETSASAAAQPGSAGGRTPVWSFLLFAVVIVLALATIGVAVDRIVLLGRETDLVKAWAANANGVSIEQARSLIDAAQTASYLSLLLLLALYGTVYGWIRALNGQLAPLEDPGWVYRLRAYFVWRISILVLAAFAFASFTLVNTDAGSTPSELIDHVHLLAWVAFARIPFALCCGWVAVSLLLTSNRLFAQLPRSLFESPDKRPRTF